MMNKTLLTLAFVGTIGVTGSALAQNYGSAGTPAAANAEPDRVVVAERVVSENPTVIERQVIVGKIMRMPERNTGVSKIGGSVGGAIGGYYINGSTAAQNRPLDIPPDAYTR
ncbi:MAG TPA: hypothetical protein VGM72_05900 [Micropepsaceae bacterium]|jgi:hypothetical protein